MNSLENGVSITQKGFTFAVREDSPDAAIQDLRKINSIFSLRLNFFRENLARPQLLEPDIINKLVEIARDDFMICKSEPFHSESKEAEIHFSSIQQIASQILSSPRMAIDIMFLAIDDNNLDKFKRLLDQNLEYIKDSELLPLIIQTLNRKSSKGLIGFDYLIALAEVNCLSDYEILYTVELALDRGKSEVALQLTNSIKNFSPALNYGIAANAIKVSNLAVFEAILAKEFNVDWRPGASDHPLIWFAVRSQNPIFFYELLKRGVNLTYNSNTLLHDVIMENLYTPASKLLEAGFNPNSRNSWGETALHIAVKNQSSLEMVQLLIQAGADPDARDNLGRTPRALAQHRLRMVPLFAELHKEKAP